MAQVYEVEVYVDERGKSPFSEWITSLKDMRAKVKIQKRIDRLSLGNFGDYKALAGTNGLYELREHYGQGFRVYYAKVGLKVVLLLAGSNKKEQQKTISKAQDYFADYNRRKDDD
ncbi:MAG: type II toxin-antitoxin system RelE/ParE family toxin [Trichodesmium sp. MAG_R04]|jgi:putative addiction module killer protein|nr:type II toxin-antitoxin system RelE/ParE family toxin [Trichodesmium sp. MAG_R04]